MKKGASLNRRGSAKFDPSNPRLLTIQTGRVRPYSWALSNGFIRDVTRAMIELGRLSAGCSTTVESIQNVIWYLEEDFGGKAPRNPGDYMVFCKALADVDSANAVTSYRQAQCIARNVINTLADAARGREVESTKLKELSKLCGALYERSQEWQYRVFPGGRRSAQRFCVP